MIQGAVVGETDRQPLDNAVWWALSSHHRRHAEAFGRAQRYHSDIAAFAAVDEYDEDSWDDLAALVSMSESARCILFGGDPPAVLPDGWTVQARGVGRQMIVHPEQLNPVEPVELRVLTTDDVPQMLELVALTKPGPFRAGTIELGRYYGHFEGEHLVAMAGERLSLRGFTEVSAVCTHPDARGRGLASTLTHHVAAGIIERDEQPFLDVAESNENARRVYERLGFCQRHPGGGGNPWRATRPFGARRRSSQAAARGLRLREALAEFLQRREMPPELVRLAHIPGAYASLEAVQALALALRHCSAFFGRSGVQRTEECRMGVSAALYAEGLGHRGVALARLTEGDHLLVEGVLCGLGVRPAWTGFALAHAPRAFTVPVGCGHVGSGHESPFGDASECHAGA